VTGIIDTNVFINANAALNFNDANSINIELIVDGQLLDTFNVDSTIVAANQKKTPRPSFEKLYNNGEWKIEASIPEHNFNIDSFTANP
jgi:hypothetical protein